MVWCSSLCSAVGPGVETITVSFFAPSCLSRSVFAWLGLGRGRARKKKVQRSESRMESSEGARREAIAGERVSLRVSRLAEHVSAAFPLPLHVPHVLRRAITLKCVPARSDFQKLRTQHLKHDKHHQSMLAHHTAGDRRGGRAHARERQLRSICFSTRSQGEGAAFGHNRRPAHPARPPAPLTACQPLEPHTLVRSFP